MKIRPTVAYGGSKALNQRGLGGSLPLNLHKHTYLHEGSTVIIEAVTPGRGWSIALSDLVDPCDLPKSCKLGMTISVSGELRSRYSL